MGEYGARLRYTVATLVTIIGAISGYIASYDLIKRFIIISGYELLIAVIYIVLFSGLIVGAFLYFQFQTVRKEKYANITHLLHNIHHKIRNLQTYINAHSPEDGASPEIYDLFIGSCKNNITSILDEVAHIFSMLSGTKCRAAIKVISQHDNGNLYVDALARDSSSTQRWSELDVWRRDQNHDLLDDNHIFKLLFSKNKLTWSFHCDDITPQTGLFSTSQSAYSNNVAIQVQEKGFMRKWFPSQSGTPYRSTVTCAIRQQPMDGIGIAPEAVGFLCVDSESRGAFEPRWDVELCFSFSDALYHPTDFLLKTMSRAP